MKKIDFSQVAKAFFLIAALAQLNSAQASGSSKGVSPSELGILNLCEPEITNKYQSFVQLTSLNRKERKTFLAMAVISNIAMDGNFYCNSLKIDLDNYLGASQLGRERREDRTREEAKTATEQDVDQTLAQLRQTIGPGQH